MLSPQRIVVRQGVADDRKGAKADRRLNETDLRQL